MRAEVKASRRGLAGGGSGMGEGFQNPRPYVTKVDQKSQEGQVVYNAQGRAVGRIEGGWLVKRGLDPECHMLRRPPAWATDAAHLSLPVVGIRLFTTTGECWEAPLETWRRYGRELDRRWGKQVLLAARYWRGERRGVRQLRLFGSEVGA